MRKETMNSGRVSALRRLTEMDARFQTTVPIPLSLSPARTRATSLHAIGEALLTEDLDPALMQAFADGLCLMVVTKVDQFRDCSRDSGFDIDRAGNHFYTLVPTFFPGEPTMFGPGEYVPD